MKSESKSNNHAHTMMAMKLCLQQQHYSYGNE